MSECFVCYQAGATQVCQCTAAAHSECLATLQEFGMRRCSICRCKFLLQAETAAAQYAAAKAAREHGVQSKEYFSIAFDLGTMLAMDNQHAEAIHIFSAISHNASIGSFAHLACQVEIARSKVTEGLIAPAVDILEHVLNESDGEVDKLANLVFTEACLVLYTVYAKTGDLNNPAVKTILARALETMIESHHPDPDAIVRCLRVIARYQMHCRNIQMAERAFRAAISLSDASGEDIVSQVEVQIDYAVTLIAMGRETQAATLLCEAISILRSRTLDATAASLLPRARRLVYPLISQRRRMRGRRHPEQYIAQMH